MHFKKITTVVVLGTVLNGCSTSKISSDSDSNSKRFSQAEVDLMIEQARVEEQQRINLELNRQAQQKQVFKRLLANKNGLQVSKKPLETGKATTHSEIHKIIPTSRKPVLYKKVDGVSYYRCAANSLVPFKDTDGKSIYTPKKRELTATLCKANRDKKTMLALQTALYNQGYLISDSLTKEQLIDGLWGETTLVAVKKYQQDNGLLFGQLSIQTLEHLGLFREDKTVDDMLGVKQIKIVKAETVDNNDTAIEPISDKDNVKVNNNAIAKSETSGDPQKMVEVVNEQVNDKKHITNQEPSQSTETEIVKIIPKSRKPVLYQNLEGVNYYRCAANSLVPVSNGSGGWKYSKGKQELSATLCKKSRDIATMTDLQYELYEKGYLKSDLLTQNQLIDGVWGETTLVALKDYQQKNGLLYGQLTIESLEHLGVFEPSEERVTIVKANPIKNITENNTVTEEDKLTLQNTVKPNDKIKIAKVKKTAITPEQKASQEKISNKEKSKNKQLDPEVKFVALKLKLADHEFDASVFVPQNSKPHVYGYVGSFKIWRCGARSILPEGQVDGVFNYGKRKEYRATLCKLNRTIPLITRLQTALRDKGYLVPKGNESTVEINGVWDTRTLEAVKSYQQKNGLAYGQLTIETLEVLGVFEKLPQ